MSEPIRVEYTKLKPVTDPMSEYDGFCPGTVLLPRGYTYQEGRRPFPVDTLCDRDTCIVMRDGIKIYADVYRPADSDTHPVPAILCWGPAGKRGMNNMIDMMGEPPEGSDAAGASFEWLSREEEEDAQPPHTFPYRMGIPRSATSGLQGWESHDPAEWVQYGYAVISPDPRGCYMSEGDVRYFGKLDCEDITDTIEAIAEMPWCTGKVGMAGNSWYAMTQWNVAGYHPPHLVCIAPWEGEGDLYRDEYMRGGIPELLNPEMSRTYGAGYIEDVGKMMEKYPLYNEYWEDKTWDFEAIDIPVYAVASYSSQMHCRGAFDGFRRCGSKEKWLRVHNVQEWVDFYTPENQADLRRFFDHYLKGEDNGWENTPAVRLSILNPGGEDRVNVPLTQWPPAQQVMEKYFLDASDMTTRAEQPEAEAAASYSTAVKRESKITFVHQFQEDTDVVGVITFKLWTQCDGYDDMDLFLRAVKTNAEGEIQYQDSICYLYSGPDNKLRVSMRELDPERSTPYEAVQSFRTVKKLAPGEVVPVELSLWPTAMSFAKGDKLELVIAGFDYTPSRAMDRPNVAADNHGTHIFHTGGRYDSYVYLPILPRQ